MTATKTRTPANGTTRGATSLGDGGDDRRKRGGWLKWLLPLLLLIGLVILLASLLGGDDKKSDSASQSGGSGQQAAPRGGAGEAGTLTARGRSILPVPSGQAGELVGGRAQGRQVTVQSVVRGEGFWVGSSAGERVYVEFGGDVGQNEQGAGAFEPRVGQKVDLSGVVRPAPENPGRTLKLKKQADAELVKRQGVFVNATDVKAAS